MKKLLLILFFLILFSCSKFGIPRKYQPPDIVFKNWQKYAKMRKYNKMFEYEYFRFNNIRYCFDKINAHKRWNSATRREQEKFIALYKETLKKLLDEKPNEKYEALLRLKKSYQIRIVRYVVNTISDTGRLYVAGDYPGEEKIRLIKVQGKWYLINPFGYHSYIPVFKALKNKYK